MRTELMSLAATLAALMSSAPASTVAYAAADGPTASAPMAVAELRAMAATDVTALLARAGAPLRRQRLARRVRRDVPVEPKSWRQDELPSVPVSLVLGAPEESLSKWITAVMDGRVPLPSGEPAVAAAARSPLAARAASAAQSAAIAVDQVQALPTATLVSDDSGVKIARVELQPASAPMAALSEEKAQVLKLTFGSGGLEASMPSVTLTGRGAAVRLELPAAAEGLALFVRDQAIVNLSPAHDALKAEAAGATELYAVHGDHMVIVPIVVTEVPAKAVGLAATAPNLAVPKALVSLEGVVAAPTKRAHLAAAATTGPIEVDSAESVESAESVAAAEPAPTESGQAALPSLSASIAETTRTMIDDEQRSRQFQTESAQVRYETLSLQVVDERSSPDASAIYPVPGARVRIIGTRFVGVTDGTGHLAVRDVPHAARLLLAIDDPAGQVRPAMAEVRSDGATGVRRLVVTRSFTFDTYTTLLGIAQDTSLGSYCGVLTEAHQRRAGVTARIIDQRAEGPFYFNQYGFLDRSLGKTGPDGRFCFFNVAPGPFALMLSDGQDSLGTYALAAFSSRHVEEPIDLSEEVAFATRLATMATGPQQLSSDGRAATALRPVDMVDLIALGEQSPLMQTGPGVVAANGTLTAHQHRLRALVQAAEFEAVLYSYEVPSGGDRVEVTPLVPRGFLDDMALYAQVTHDPALGSVLAEFAPLAGTGQEPVSLRLVDAEGRPVGDGWYYADAPLTKAIFFNVPAGTYTVLAETKDGFWLAADTLTVYSETMTYARLGAKVRYQTEPSSNSTSPSP